MPITDVGAVADLPGEQRQPGKPTDDFRVAMLGDSQQAQVGADSIEGCPSRRREEILSLFYPNYVTLAVPGFRGFRIMYLLFGIACLQARGHWQR